LEALKPKLPVFDKTTAFWNAYKVVADEFDKEFHQKYNTDLDTALILWVAIIVYRECLTLFCIVGWSFLGSQLSVHYSNSARAPTGPHGHEPGSCAPSYSQLQRVLILGCRSFDSKMERPG
jgi:hypothetical protein